MIERCDEKECFGFRLARLAGAGIIFRAFSDAASGDPR